MSSDDDSHFSLFRDCIALHLLAKQQPSDVIDTSDLDDFINFLATESWSALPSPLQQATYQSRSDVPEADDIGLETTSHLFTESLVSYGIVGDAEDAIKFLRRVVERYRAEACAPPPVWSLTRTEECEICEREVPLTYHHLIPRSTHDKVLKKGWHDKVMLNSVAWLCRPCHSMVHHIAPNEVLAKEFYTVELLLQREDIQKWRNYQAKQRWSIRPKKRPRQVPT